MDWRILSLLQGIYTKMFRMDISSKWDSGSISFFYFSVFSSVSIWSWCLKTSRDNIFSWSFSWTNELLRKGISPQEHNRKVTCGFMWLDVLLLFFVNISEFSDTWNLCNVNRSLDLLLGPWKSKLHLSSHKGWIQTTNVTMLFENFNEWKLY